MEDSPSLRIEVGLDVIYDNLPDGVQLTHREIAEICGVDHSAIWQLEKKTLQKLKSEFNRK